MRIEQISTTCSEGSINAPLNEINYHLAEFPKETPFVLYCGGGIEA